MTNEVRHTDAIEQAKFLALSPDMQLLQIWLNGRETNGSVADVKRDVAIMQPKVDRHDFWFKIAAVVVGLGAWAGPLVFWAMAQKWH